MGLLFCPQVMPQKSTSIPSTTTATQMTQRAPQTNSAAAPQTSCARSPRAATIITTNLAYKKWGEVFDGAASINAAVDRFAQHCLIIDIDGESYRQRKADPPKPGATKKPHR